MLFALTAVLTVLAFAPAGALSASADPRAEGITRWIEVELREVEAHRVNPPRAARGLALLSVATHRAARAAHTERNAAVAGAAAVVLTYLYADRAPAFEALVRGVEGRASIRRGRRIGERVVARARRDGSDANWQGTVPRGLGTWVPTPPAFMPVPLEPLAGTWATWHLDSASQLRPPPPPRAASVEYEHDMREVYTVSTSLRPDRKRIVDFWADGPGSVTPPGHWNRIALDVIRSHRLSAMSTARILAAMNTVQADAFVACWDTKFAYWTERPVTAIQREVDPGWMPYLETPPFPSFVSGHATTSGAASTVLAHFFPREASRLRGLAAEAAMSRLYAGIHFRRDNEAGLALGRKVARLALERARPGIPR